MAGDQLQAFLETIKADPSLKEKLTAAGDAEAVAAIAKDSGLTISRDVACQAMERMQAQLNEDETSGINGGDHGSAQKRIIQTDITIDTRGRV